MRIVAMQLQVCPLTQQASSRGVSVAAPQQQKCVTMRAICLVARCTWSCLLTTGSNVLTCGGSRHCRGRDCSRPRERQRRARSPQSRGAASVPGKPLGHAGRQPAQHLAGLQRAARPRGRRASGAGSPWWRPDRAAEGGGRGRRRGRRWRRARQRHLSRSASSSSARWTWSAAWRRAWARAWRRWWRARCCARCCCSAARRAPRSRAPLPPGPSCAERQPGPRCEAARRCCARRGGTQASGLSRRISGFPDAGRVRPPRLGDDGRMLATLGRPGSECSDAHAQAAAPDTPGGRPPGPPARAAGNRRPGGRRRDCAGSPATLGRSGARRGGRAPERARARAPRRT